MAETANDGTGGAIYLLTKEQHAIRQQMQKHPTLGSVGYIKNFRGELDITLNKTAITDTDTGYRLIRGRNIGFYSMVDAGKAEYVSPSFVEKTAKCRYIGQPRLACQQIANMAKKRRICFSPIPADHVLGNSCNFVCVEPNGDGVDLYFLMGVLNSSLIDGYFRATSSNNHINNYEIDALPIPVSYGKKTAFPASSAGCWKHTICRWPIRSRS